IAFTPELLNDMHLVGMEVSAAPDPRGVDEANGIEHEGIALPAPYSIAEVLVVEPRVGRVLAAVGRDHAKFRHAPAGIGKLLVEERDVVLRLEDAPWRALARVPERLARHHGVFPVGPHVELLDFVPVLRLVDRAAQHAEPRRGVALEVRSLIRGSIARLL